MIDNESPLLTTTARREPIPALSPLASRLMTASTVNELLNSTAIGCGLHRWSIEGGAIDVPTDELRPVLEKAYDPNMEWVELISYDDEGGWHVA